MKIHTIKLVGYSPSASRILLGTQGSYGVDYIDFELSDEWDGMSYNVTFYPRGSKQPWSRIYSGEPIKVPAAVYNAHGTGQMIITGFSEGVKRISLKVDLHVPETLEDVVNPDPDIPPATHAQMMALMAKAVDTAKSVEERANSGELDGKSAYEIAVEQGFIGTEAEWLESLKGKDAPIPVAESHTIAAWAELSDAEPFTHSATITASAAIFEDTQVELINNNAVLFAKHGFAIAAVNGQAITIYSVDEPTASVTLRIEIGG